ncbi:MAG: hypothetical protein HY713_00905 [candidate division NC10 bacterium]|nr:hypothetical protein [candidate division NC10 bacterium]
MRDKLAQGFSRSIHRPLAHFSRSANGDFPVAGEIVEHQEVVYVQTRVPLHEFKEFAAGLLPFYGYPNSAF